MLFTGQHCPQSGLYRSTCECATETTFDQGDILPPCRNHGHVHWHFLRPH
jgi:hypothetical protein